MKYPWISWEWLPLNQASGQIFKEDVNGFFLQLGYLLRDLNIRSACKMSPKAHSGSVYKKCTSVVKKIFS
jgi:hypothetical protein